MSRGRIVRFAVAASFLILSIFSGTAFAATARAAVAANAHPGSTLHTQTTPISSTASCAHLQVYLHGTQQATVKCLDKHTDGSAMPYGISPVPCDSGSLVLWENNGFTGDTLCFKGAGATDLTAYCLPWYRGGCLGGTWNDRVSSYGPGCSSGRLYYDIGENNVLASFGANGSRQNLSGSQNDAASSVRLDRSC